MGITGLIPFLEKASSKIHLNEIKGSTVAIDTYCWLHKGAFACAEKLCRNEPTDIYIHYCMKYVNMLLSFNIKPILVFDGRHLPAKELTEKRRRDSRKECKRKAKELLREGKTSEASSFLRRAIDVTHEMALKVIQECRRRNVDCIVAPYEADAQMAYLNKIGIADYIITEDSDLVLFGTTKTIFKLDFSAQGLLVDSSKLYLGMGCSENKFTFDKFRIMCILSGCDYLDSLHGIGLAKACKFVLLTAETDMAKALLKLPSYLNLKNVVVTKEYIDGFLKAEATFKHMFVFDPFKRSVVRLHDLPKDVYGIEDICSNAGVDDLDKDTALNLALGNLNPFTLKKLDNYHPDTFQLKPPGKFENIKIAKHSSIWSKTFKKYELQQQDKTCAFQFNVVKKCKAKTTRESFEEDEEKYDDSNIVAMYAQKEYEIPLESENDEPSEKEDLINKKRNPFGKKVCSRSLLTEASSSLIKSLSPKKLSKGEPQTVREVRSRFFLPFVKKEVVKKYTNGSQPRSENLNSIKTIDDELEDPSESTNSVKRKGSNNTKSSPKRSFFEVEGLEDCLENEINNNSNQHVDEGDVRNEKLVSCDSGLSTESSLEEDEDVIVISVEKGDSKKPINFLTNAKKVTTKQKIRAVGLPKPKKKKEQQIDSSKNQSSLSMFGFQKRHQV